MHSAAELLITKVCVCVCVCCTISTHSSSSLFSQAAIMLWIENSPSAVEQGFPNCNYLVSISLITHRLMTDVNLSLSFSFPLSPPLSLSPCLSLSLSLRSPLPSAIPSLQPPVSSQCVLSAGGRTRVRSGFHPHRLFVAGGKNRHTCFGWRSRLGLLTSCVWLWFNF